MIHLAKNISFGLVAVVMTLGAFGAGVYGAALLNTQSLSAAAVESKIKQVTLPDNALMAKSAVLYELGTGRILYQKNAHEQLPLASLTKLMSIEIVLSLKSADTPVQITRGDIATDGDSGLRVGQTIMLGDLIKFAMVASSNDAMEAAAASLGKDFIGKDKVALILGDNIFENDFKKAVSEFKEGAAVFFKKVKDPKRFGVPVFSKDGKKILRVEEKPKKPKSSYAQTGFYIFDATVFSVIKTLKPSGRGELEMTDAVNHYVRKGDISFYFVQGAWLDAGTFESLFTASAFVRNKKL